jgi:site-specific recombinase XerD
MPQPRPPYLHRYHTRHDKFIWYVRKGARGRRIHLRSEYGTEAFWEEYRAAIEASTIRPKAEIKACQGTLEWAWALYRQSAAWQSAISQATRRQRENIMKHVLATAGTIPLSQITPAAIREGVNRRASTPFQAKNFVQCMRQFFQWLKESEIVSVNPCDGVTVKKPKTRGFPEWTVEEIIQFEQRWPLGTRERVMLDVYCYTGLRRGDAATVGKQHVRNGVISIQTEKTGQWVHIPMLDVLKRTLDAGPSGDLAFICKKDGQPFVKEGLGNALKDACRAAGIMDKSAHGLRKAAATRAADNGATAHELMAIFGWKDIKEAEIYTRAANRKHLAAKAMSKLEQ